ncbi:MAG: hypothetical protein HYU41_14140 [Candidatus Rokubacteria bacterium]|nr:hypothetical protein [Candidatus Rokubacteria bacterium]
MKYKFTRVWSRLMVVVGIVFIALGVVSAGIAGFTDEWRPGVTGTQEAIERALLVGALLMSGILAGSPFIVFGQLLEIFLDQRRLLTRIERRLRRAKTPAPPKKPDAYPRL